MRKRFCSLMTIGILAMSTYCMAEEEEILVTVNGQMIYQSEFDEMVSTVSSRMSLYGIDVEDETVIETIEQSALQELIDDHLLTQDMTAQGCYEFTDEEEDSIVSTAQISMENLVSQYEEYFESYMEEYGLDGITAAELAESYISESGYSLEYMENYYRNAYASEKYEEWLMRDAAEITEEEIQAEYEKRVQESKEAYENDISAFETAMLGGEEVWYRPDGYRAVLQIMLPAEGETEEEKLAFVQETTDEIYARLEEGEAFENLILEYGEDTTFETEGFMETGYQVHPESVMWEEAFVSAVFGEEMQEIGDYTQPLVFDENVHILYYLKDVPEETVELTDALAASLKEELYGSFAEEKLQKRLAALTEEAEIIYAE